MLRRLPAALLCLALFAAGAGAQAKVSVAAASNLAAVAPALSAAFARAHPEYRAEFVFGASGTLATQLLNGAPFEVFLSADLDFAQRLVDEGIAQGPVKVYALGSLVFLTTRHLDLSKGLAILSDPLLRQIAIANPETAPYGRAAEQALLRAGLLGAVRGRLVMAQNITQALQFTLTSTDGGFVNASALRAKDLVPWNREGEYWFAIDPSLYDPIEQGFVVMKAGLGWPAVRAFVAFLSSSAARSVLAASGYSLP
jgi:molybdate transport system substrate-binding protein